MASIIAEFECDIFVSYRQNDNRSGWVTEFVRKLKEELAATIKDPISLYLDSNPDDGLLETHNVHKSLEGKLKCVVFMPILSQTYCDIRSFAWQHEFVEFNKLAKEDQFGREIKLSNGNVSSRIIPVRIHDLDAEDKAIIESELGCPLRSIEFIYKEPGVNRPLKPTDNKQDNLYKTEYQNQVNKVAIAVKDLIYSIKTPGSKIFLDSQKSEASILNESAESAIAVLPFANLTNDAAQEYFCDGITEEIINTLTSFASLRVIARTSAFAYKNKSQDLVEIGNRLGVNYILEGSIRKAGDKIRLNAGLVDLRHGTHIWNGKFDRDLTDIFLIQEEIAQSIASQLKILSHDKFSRPRTNNMEAFNLYLMGRDIVSKGKDGWPRISIEFFNKATQKDPKFASAHAAIALSAWVNAFEGQKAAQELVKSHAALALQIDNNNAEAHAAIALSKYYNEWKWAEAESEFIKALRINPWSVLSLHHFGTLLSNLGRCTDALRLLNRALTIDPLNTVINQTVGWCYFAMRDFERSRIQSQETLNIEPSNFLARIVLCFALIELKSYDEAKSLIASMPEDNLFAKACEVWLNASSGNIELARNITSEMLKKGMESPSCVAWMMIAINEIDEAFVWLNKALEKKDLMILSLPVFTWWDPIRNDARFHDVLMNTGLSEYLRTFSPLPF